MSGTSPDVQARAFLPSFYTSSFSKSTRPICSNHSSLTMAHALQSPCIDACCPASFITHIGATYLRYAEPCLASTCGWRSICSNPWHVYAKRAPAVAFLHLIQYMCFQPMGRLIFLFHLSRYWLKPNPSSPPISPVQSAVWRVQPCQHALRASESCQRVCQRDRHRELVLCSPHFWRPSTTPSQLLPSQATGSPFLSKHPARHPLCCFDLVCLQQHHSRQHTRRRRFLRAVNA